jgi:hypothetical protein
MSDAKLEITMEKGTTRITGNKYLPTQEGMIEVALLTLGGRTTGSIALPPCLEAERHDNAVDALTSLILAHACAGVDVESPAYVKGVNVALDAIRNQE